MNPPSPEKSSLERTPIVSSLAWLGLLSLAALLGAFIFWLFFGNIERLVDGRGIVIRDSNFGIFEVASPVAGTIDQVFVQEGDKVRADQTLLSWHGKSAQENLPPLRAIKAGRITEVIVSQGSVVAPGRTVMRMESVQGPQEVLAYVSAAEGKKIQLGMPARVVPESTGIISQNYLPARVAYVSSHPITKDYLRAELGGNESLVELLLANRSCIEVVLEFEEASISPADLEKITSGLLVNAFIILQETAPIRLLRPEKN